MDGPQLEDGFTRIANELLDALIKNRIPGEQMQCLLFIIRKTYGFNRLEDNISNSQFTEATGMKKGNVSRAISSLVEKNIVIKSDNKRIPSYRFNKHYKSWKLLSKKQPVINIATSVIKTDNKLLSKVMDTKEKKETITKETPDFYLTKKKRKLNGKRLESFDRFWEAFSYRKDRASAADSWLDIPVLTDVIVEEIISAAKQTALKRPELIKAGRTPQYAQGWLTGRRWEDESYQSEQKTRRYIDL